MTDLDPLESTNIAAYDYVLPPERIAQTPIEPRDSARLMVIDRARDTISHSRFSAIGDFLRDGDLLVANESRVLPARLHGTKRGTGGTTEILLLAARPELGPTVWETLVKPGRRLRSGYVIEMAHDLTAEILEPTSAGGRLVRFLVAGEANPTAVQDAIEAIGEMPLPPYIHQPLRDPERYQTVYSRTQGSAAAPTAGLHFTPQLLERLRAQGIDMAHVCLHVGLDTFRPVEVSDLRQHHMHSEAIALDEATAEAINQTRRADRRVVAVGTTTVRTLESVASLGMPLRPYAGPTTLFITPGFTFQVTDAIITNFHLPRSTLLAMISAFAGRERVLAAYQMAIDMEYRFYSFGDAMLIL